MHTHHEPDNNQKFTRKKETKNPLAFNCLERLYTTAIANDLQVIAR
jgi:hypothetical protein